MRPPEWGLSDLVMNRFAKTSVAFAVHDGPLFESQHRQGMAGVDDVAFSAPKHTLVFSAHSAVSFGSVGHFLKFHGNKFFS